MLSSRRRGYLDAVGVLICEMALFCFFLLSGGLLGNVPFVHFWAWARSTGAETALTALFRLLGLGVSGWLLFSTLIYSIATISGSRRLLKGSRLVTLPFVRRALDALAVASMAASTIGTVAGAASAVPAPKLAAVAAARPWPGWGPITVAPGATTRAGPGGGSRNAGPDRVSVTAVGRHIPHPGTATHTLPPRAPAIGSGSQVPSPANGFAGLVPGTKVVVVQPGDCLSVLAQRYLGDWRLDTEIEALNWGRLQPDGRALVDDHWIYPGWVLVMPSDAQDTLVVGSHAERPVAPSRAVAHHSGLLAHRSEPPAHRSEPPAHHLGPGGVRHGHIPGEAGRHSAAADRAGEVGVPNPGPQEVPSLTASCAPVPGPKALRPAPLQAAHTPARVPGPLPAPAHEASPGAGRREHSAGDDEEAEVALVGIGAVAAAGIVWRLDRRRREQGHARPKGRVFARNDAPVEAAERRARAVAANEAVTWVDLVLRYLTGLVEQMSFDGVSPVPSLVLVRVGDRGLEVVLSPAPEGRLGWFSANEDRTAFVLDADITLEDLKGLAEQRWPAWPALVSIGESGGATLLLNLEHAGSLSVEGPDQKVEAALAGFAVQLASQPWCEEMLAGLYTTGRNPLSAPLGARHVDSTEALELAEKFDRISGAHQELAADQALSTLRALASEALPNVAVAFDGTPASALRCLAEAAVPDRSGVAVVGAGPYPGARWHLVLEGQDQALLQGPIGACAAVYELTVNCDPQEVGLLSQALGATDDQDGVPASSGSGTAPGTPAPVVDISGDEAAARGDVEICVLGPVDLIGGDPSALERSRRMAPLAVLAYLGTHPRAVSADELASNLWPLDVARDDLGGPQRKTVMNVVSRARALLGYGLEGQERLVHSPMGYRLSEEVTCDWARFEHLVAAARRQGPAQAAVSLRRALELVRGEPFGGALSSQFFEWVASEHLDMVLSAKVVDVAQDLGEMALEAGDLATVMWAVEKGLQLEPAREEMFRLWMHSQGRAGRPAKVDDVYRRLQLVLRQRIHPLQEPQAESREVWKSYTAVEVASTQS